MTDSVIYKTQNRAPCVGNIIISPQNHAQMRLAQGNSKNLLTRSYLFWARHNRKIKKKNVFCLQNQSINFSIWFLQTISNNPFLKESLKALISAVSAYDISQYFFYYLNYSFDLCSFWLQVLTTTYCTYHCAHSLEFFSGETKWIRHIIFVHSRNTSDNQNFWSVVVCVYKHTCIYFKNRHY